MSDLNAAIDLYISYVIALSKKDISAAANSRDWFLKRLANEVEARTNEPVLFGDQFLGYGSYFKGTKVADVDEFDVLMKIDSNSGQFSVENMKVGSGQGSADPNHKYDQKYMKDDGTGVSPSKILNWTKGIVDAVVQAHGGEAPEKAGQAVTAHIASQGLDIDIVPGGVFKRDADGQIFYNIPRGDKNNGWIMTSPEVEMKELEKAADGKNDFRNVIRIAKRIKDTYNLQVPSFAIERAAVNYVGKYVWYNDLARDLSGFLWHLGEVLRAGSILDPFDDKTNMLRDIENLPACADKYAAIRSELSKCKDITDQDEANQRVQEILDNL